VGYLPANLAQVRHALDVERVAGVLLDIFRRFDLPDEAREEVLATLSSH
jgi:hypothetical protein